MAITTSAPRKKHHLDGRFPRAGNKENHAPRGDRGHQNQPQPRQQIEGQRGAPALHLEARLDLRFEGFEVPVNAPRRHAAQLAIDAVEVGENRERRP